jgi:2-polyprenyl-6-methoxyphenol hydroxylase-like FAD-dependent oxidoreductase
MPAADVARDWDAIMMQPTPSTGKRGGLILPMENGHWQVLLLGAGGDYPPTDEDGFMDYARSLPSRALYDALQGATPLSPIYGYRRTENRLRHYDKLPRYLEHFLVMGDSVCAFNPMYGQGMSVASMESLVLDECLKAHRAKAPTGDLRGLAQTFQKRVAGVVAMPWQLASGEDLRWASKAKPTLPGRVMGWYIEQILRATVHNTAVAETFTRVQNMLDGPGALFSPNTMRRVFATRLTGRG